MATDCRFLILGPRSLLDTYKKYKAAIYDRPGTAWTESFLAGNKSMAAHIALCTEQHADRNTYTTVISIALPTV